MKTTQDVGNCGDEDHCQYHLGIDHCHTGNDLNDTGIGGAKNHGLKNGSTFKVQTLHLSLPVVVQFLYGIIAVTEGGDQVRLHLLT